MVIASKLFSPSSSTSASCSSRRVRLTRGSSALTAALHVASTPTRLSGSGARRSRGLLLLRFGLLFDGLDLDLDLDFVADHQSTVEERVHGQAEVLAIDLSFGAVGDAMAHHARVIELAIAHDRQRHLTRVALDRQVAGHRVVVGARRLDPGALEGDPRVLLELQE